MKTRADLLVRDALAAQFVRACADDARAELVLSELDRWRQGATTRAELLMKLETEHGEAIFTPSAQLAERYEPLADYIRDRVLRMHAALGWLADLGEKGDGVASARAAWDAGLFFEVHELLEPLWLEESGQRKLALQGLILAGAGLYHLTRGNLAGARGLLGDAERKLQESPKLDALELCEFGRELGEVSRAIERGELRSWEDIVSLPRF